MYHQACWKQSCRGRFLEADKQRPVAHPDSHVGAHVSGSAIKYCNRKQLTSGLCLRPGFLVYGLIQGMHASCVGAGLPSCMAEHHPLQQNCVFFWHSRPDVAMACRHPWDHPHDVACKGLHPDPELPVQKRKQARDPAAQINGSLYKGVRDAGQERESTLEVVCRLVYMLLIQTRRLPEECCHEQDDHAAPLGSRRRHPRYQQLPTSCGPPSRATSSAPRSRLKPWESCGRHKPVNGGSIRGVTGGVKISCGHVTRLH